MRSAHSRVGDERVALLQALPTIALEGMFQALGGDRDGMLCPSVAGICCSLTGDNASLASDVESNPSCVICRT